MGAAYHIMGRSVPAHQLAIATLGLVTLLAIPKPWNPAPKHPKIIAESEDEKKFIEKYVQDHLKAEKH